MIGLSGCNLVNLGIYVTESLKREQNPAICDDMNKLGEHYAK